MRGLVFSHGWGFDSHYWDILREYFSDFHCIFLDRGYFSAEPLSPLHLNPDVKIWFGVGHSLGFAHLLQSQYPLSGIIGLQCFTHFLGYQKAIRDMREKALAKMILNFSKYPDKILKNFHKICGFDLQILNYEQINYSRLQTDLQTLCHIFTGNFINLPILILASQEDPIVPPSVIEDNFGGKSNFEILFTENAHHGLGIYNSAWCAEKIRFYIEDVKL